MKKSSGKGKTIKKVFAGAILSLGICIAAAGWAREETKTRGFMDFAHIEGEYLETIRELNWPEGTVLPEELEGEDTGASFQAGYGETRASHLWEAAWMKEWLDSYDNDEARAKMALEELEKAFDMPYMGEDRCDDATRRFFKEYMEKAKAGDPSGFMMAVEING